MMVSFPLFGRGPSVRFSTLSEAISFLGKSLDSMDSGPVQKACVNQRRKWEDNTWKVLLSVHNKTPLNQLYASREFPEGLDAFVLGGHESELGHVHIDFVKKGKWWYLDSIWMCR